MTTKLFNKLINERHQDNSAIEEIYLYYNSKIILHLSYMFGQELAEECSQEFFVKLLENYNDYKYIKYPTSWIYKCCENIAKRKIKNKYFQFETLQVNENIFLLSENKCYLDLYNEMDKLDVDSKQILIMIYWKGYNQKEISEIMNLTAVTVRKKHSRALKKLKNFYEKYSLK